MTYLGDTAAIIVYNPGQYSVIITDQRNNCSATSYIGEILFFFFIIVSVGWKFYDRRRWRLHWYYNATCKYFYWAYKLLRKCE